MENALHIQELLEIDGGAFTAVNPRIKDIPDLRLKENGIFENSSPPLVLAKTIMMRRVTFLRMRMK